MILPDSMHLAKSTLLLVLNACAALNTPFRLNVRYDCEDDADDGGSNGGRVKHST